MELKYLNTFMTIVHEGGFAKAAAKLNYAQSTITFQIGQLEQEFNTKLFEKSGRTMRLTKAGEQFLPYAENALAAIERIYDFQGDLAAFHGELHIGTAESLLCYHLPPVLQAFSSKAPHAKIFVHVMDSSAIQQMLPGGGLDVGILYGDSAGLGGGIRSVCMGTYSVGLFASPATQRKYPDFITGGREMEVPLITDVQGCPFRKMLDGYLDQRNIRLGHVIELGSVHTMKRLAEADMGITILPHFAVGSELSSGRLVEIPTEMEDPYVTAFCGYDPKRWISPAMQLFIDLCGR